MGAYISQYVRQQERQKSEMERINKKVELQELQKLLELEIMEQIQEYNKKAIELINSKNDIIERVLEKYQKKQKLLINNIKYYENDLYFKFDTILNKQINIYSRLENINKTNYISFEEVRQIEQERKELAKIVKPKIEVGKMSKMLTAIFFKP